MVVMLLFPPFELIHQIATLNQGYGFLFSPPSWGATVNLKLLILQWVALLVAAAIGWYFLKEKEQ
jgi:hypothetical protein